jgi:hypothetical protein
MKKLTAASDLYDLQKYIVTNIQVKNTFFEKFRVKKANKILLEAGNKLLHDGVK